MILFRIGDVNRSMLIQKTHYNDDLNKKKIDSSSYREQIIALDTEAIYLYFAII